MNIDPCSDRINTEIDLAPGAGDEVLDADPDTSPWQRLKAAVISWLMTDGQL